MHPGCMTETTLQPGRGKCPSSFAPVAPSDPPALLLRQLRPPALAALAPLCAAFLALPSPP